MPDTFIRGVHPPHFKKTQNLQILPVSPPDRVYISLSQHYGAPAKCIVTQGQRVKAGEMIGEAAEGEISAHVFSSVSGKVIGIAERSTLEGANAVHVEIENDFRDECRLLPPLSHPSPSDIVRRVKDAGVTGMGGAAFPTHIKLTPPEGAKVDTLIINAAECEPYLTCDHRIMIDCTDDFLKGALLMKKALSAEKLLIAVEDNKQDAIDALCAKKDVLLIKSFKNAQNDSINVIVLKTKYPLGAERQLIYSATKRVVPEGGLPSSVGVCVNNVHTALAVYRAVAEGKTLCERVLTVSGGACSKPGNMWVKSGTLYSHLAKLCGGDGSAKAVIGGGPMMGVAVQGEVSVTCGTSAVLFLTAEENNVGKTSACINCGRCVKACPMKLMPVFIDSNVLNGNYRDAKRYGAPFCIECGCCSYVCPASKPLVQSIKLAKKVIRERKL